jgi:hypothetical protein
LIERQGKVNRSKQLSQAREVKKKGKGSVFTGKRTIEDWHNLFPDPVIANSAMDRIAHNAH